MWNPLSEVKNTYVFASRPSTSSSLATTAWTISATDCMHRNRSRYFSWMLLI